MKGPAVRDNRQPGWGWFNNSVVDLYGPLIKADGLAIYTALARFANNSDQTARPSVPTLAACTGLSDRQVRRVLVRLEGYGLIRIEARVDADGRQSSNNYALLPVPPVDPQSTPLDCGSRGGDTQSGGRVTHSQGEGDTQSPKLDVVELDEDELNSVGVGVVDLPAQPLAPPPPPPPANNPTPPTTDAPPPLPTLAAQRFRALYPARASPAQTARIGRDVRAAVGAGLVLTPAGLEHALLEAADKHDPWEFAIKVWRAKPNGPPQGATHAELATDRPPAGGPAQGPADPAAQAAANVALARALGGALPDPGRAAG